MSRRIAATVTLGMMMLAMGPSEAVSPSEKKYFSNGKLPAICAAGREIGGACFKLASDDRYVSLSVTTGLFVFSDLTRPVPFRIRFTDANGLPLDPASYKDLHCGSVTKYIPTGAATLVVDPSETGGGTSGGAPCLTADDGTISASFSPGW